MRPSLLPLAGTAVALSLVAYAHAGTVQDPNDPNVFIVDKGVDFEIRNIGASDFTFSWTDESGSYTDVADPKFVLTAGETYTFTRFTGAHPFVITDPSLPVNTSGGFGSFVRATSSGLDIDNATLQPIADFTADPATDFVNGGPDFIEWTPGVSDIGDYFYTCRVTGHTGMTGAIEVVAGPQRSVQFRSVDLDRGVIEIFNFSAQDIDLSGWRFCSHDFDQQRRYTAPAGLSGVVIESRTSVRIYLNNDAPAGNADAINGSQLVNFAGPLGAGPFGIQLFFPDTNGSVSFSNSSLIADHLQFSPSGVDAGLAETRTGQAVGQGLWTAAGEFVVTSERTSRIELNDLSGGSSHGPDSYDALERAACSVADIDRNGGIDVFDLIAFLQAFDPSDPACSE